MALICKNFDLITTRLPVNKFLIPICYVSSSLTHQQIRGYKRSNQSPHNVLISNSMVESKTNFCTSVTSLPSSTPTTNPPKNSDEISFDTLLRQSTFISLGDLESKIIEGKIYHTIDNDLYIDFGGKFHCVCKRPSNGIEYVRGAKVKLRLNDWELSARFLGSSKDMTLLEADCTLLGIISSPVKPPTKQIKS